ncbi:MAG: D-glycero-beta-D-manno-heptose 1-phosphate adenylyltransferase [Saprospiraceae bacterium]
MNHLQNIKEKIMSLDIAKIQCQKWKEENQKIVFTNGCFDLLHQGHITYLSHARNLGNKLIVGLNSDTSVKRLKGNFRPINDEVSRAMMLSAFSFVDAVVLFGEDTPLELIEFFLPDILVKGGDYTKAQIVGAKEVEENGGKVEIISFLKGFSSTNIIEKIRNS